MVVLVIIVLIHLVPVVEVPVVTVVTVVTGLVDKVVEVDPGVLMASHMPVVVEVVREIAQVVMVVREEEVEVDSVPLTV